MTPQPQPYGPNSPAIRRFLVQLAGLGAADRAQVVAAFQRIGATRAWDAAERTMAEALTASDRGHCRDALSGPLLQLVRRPERVDASPQNAAEAEEDADVDDADVLATLDPIAEPALAALLAILVADLVDPTVVRTLCAPFDGVIADER